MDALEAGRIRALARLRHLKLGEEERLYSDDNLLWMGVGLLVGHGALYYRGGCNTFAFSTRGKRQAEQLTASEIVEAMREYDADPVG
jgi:hypothetical protein